MISSVGLFNRKNTHRGMLNDLGISDEVQRQSVVYSALHQVTMRSAARNPDSKAHVKILVPDMFMADDVADALGGAFIGDADGKLPERFRVSTGCELNAKNEDYKDSILPGFGVALSTNKNPRAASAPFPEFDDDPDPRVVVTWNELRPRFDNPAKNYDTRFKSEPVRVLQLVAYLKRMHERVRADKTGDKLFQLTQFDEDVPITASWLNRRNFQLSYGLLLDFDGGSVTPEEFERIFWHDAGSHTKLPFIITNTFSSTRENAKFRAIVPFKDSTHSIAHFKAVVNAFINRLEKNGHPLKTSGLDSKAARDAVHRYLLPCTNAARPEAAFFRAHGLRRSDEFLRYAVDPNRYVPAPRKQWTRKMKSPQNTVINKEAVLEKADEIKREIDGMLDGRRAQVFAVACTLAAIWPLHRVYEDLMDWASDENIERHVEVAVEYLESVPWSQAA